MTEDRLNRLLVVHRELHKAMDELINKKDPDAAEQLLRIVDKLLLKLIEDAGGLVVP